MLVFPSSIIFSNTKDINEESESATGVNDELSNQ